VPFAAHRVAEQIVTFHEGKDALIEVLKDEEEGSNE